MKFFFYDVSKKYEKKKRKAKKESKEKKYVLKKEKKNGVKQIKRVSGERVGTCLEQHFIYLNEE